MTQVSVAVITDVLNTVGFSQLLTGGTGTIFCVIGLIFALLNCFFGYKLRRIWGILFGFFGGFALGAMLASNVNQSSVIALIISIACGAALGIMAFLLYRPGLLVMVGGMALLLLYTFVPAKTTMILLIELVIAVIIAVITLVKERFMVILLTGIGGAYLTAYFMMQLCHVDMFVFQYLWTGIFSVFGLVFQFHFWKDKKDRRKEDRKNSKELKQDMDRHHDRAKDREKADRRREAEARSGKHNAAFGRNSRSDSGFRRVEQSTYDRRENRGSSSSNSYHTDNPYSSKRSSGYGASTTAYNPQNAAAFGNSNYRSDNPYRSYGNAYGTQKTNTYGSAQNGSYGAPTGSYGSGNAGSYGTQNNSPYGSSNSYGSQNSNPYGSSSSYGSQNSNLYGSSSSYGSQNSSPYGSSSSYGTQSGSSYQSNPYSSAYGAQQNNASSTSAKDQSTYDDDERYMRELQEAQKNRR